MRGKLFAVCSLSGVVVTSPILAAEPALLTSKGPPIIASSPWQFELGSRYWFSSGNHRFDLYDPFVTPQLNSRLTFGDLTGHSAELFFRVEHDNGVFFKGFIGGGSLASGKLNDEDFPAALRGPYSNTVSVQSGGSLKYATVDLGYNVIQTILPTGQVIKVGPFVGYNHFHDRINTFGCSQVGANQGICGALPPIFAPIPTIYDALDADASWNSLRSGVAGEVILLPRTRAFLEAAWVHSWLWNTDYHNFRPDIRAMQQSGQGDGFQIEGLLSYDITPRLSVGVGGRFWQFNATGKNHWERKLLGVLAGVPSAPLNTLSERYGAFLQASYRFGGPSDESQAGQFGPAFGKAESEPHDWNGAYLGANVGYGWGDSSVTQFTALSPLAGFAQSIGAVPFSQGSNVAGFVGGGQIGYNFSNQLLVAGLEADLQYANIGGSYGATDLFSGFYTNSKRLLEWLGTTRGRVGFLLRNDLLLYGTGGFAFGGVNAQSAGTLGVGFACSVPFNNCVSGGTSRVATGWTAGAGVELAVHRNLSLKAEWLYVGLGQQSYLMTDAGIAAAFGLPITLRATTSGATQIVRTGLNYRLDWANHPAGAALPTPSLLWPKGEARRDAGTGAPAPMRDDFLPAGKGAAISAIDGIGSR